MKLNAVCLYVPSAVCGLYCCRFELCFLFCLPGAVSPGGLVSVYGTSAGPPWSLEPAGTQSVRSRHHGRGLGKSEPDLLTGIWRMSRSERKKTQKTTQ